MVCPTTTASTAPTVLPQLPTFVPDPSNPRGATTWLKQVEMKFSLSATLTAQQKIALVSSALDCNTFDRVTRGLLPDDIAVLADWDKFKTVFINLFDTKRSLFANRYDAFQIEWLGPAREPLHEYIARVRQIASAFDCTNFSANELSTLLVLMGMKAAALEPLRSLVLNALITTPKETLEKIETLLDNALMTERDQKLPQQSRVGFVKKIDPRNQRKSAPVSSKDKKPPKTPCRGCGALHWNADCPFKDAKCRECGTVGHIQKVCPNKNNDSSKGRKPHRAGNKIGFVQIASLGTTNPSAARIYVDIVIDDKPLYIQYDCGADITILSRHDYKKIGSPFLAKATVRARDVNSKPIPLDGCFTAKIRYMDTCKRLTLHVADIPDSLLGLDYCNKVTLLPSSHADPFVAQVSSPAAAMIPETKVDVALAQSTVDDLIKEFDAVFQPGLGRCSKAEIHLQLKPNTRPVFVPARRMSQQGLEVARTEITRLCELDVMERYEGFTDYATPGSIVKRKDGRSRFVVDYSTGLNAQLEEPSYQLPVPEDIYNQLAGCKFFTQLDLSDAYHQVPLDEESQMLTMVSTWLSSS